MVDEGLFLFREFLEVSEIEVLGGISCDVLERLF